MAKTRFTVASATALVNAALNDAENTGRINTLRGYLKRRESSAKARKEQENYSGIAAQRARLPKYKLANQKYTYSQWTSFQLWVARTLKSQGLDYQPSKDVLELFARFANDNEMSEMNHILND